MATSPMPSPFPISFFLFTCSSTREEPFAAGHPEQITIKSMSNLTTEEEEHDADYYLPPAARLRRLIAQPGCLQAPGVYDGISARAGIEAGFKCLYQSGSMTTASLLGLPDLAFASLPDFLRTGQMIAHLDESVPLIADADTGFGGPTAVARTVREYDRAGIAGLHIEDQVTNKRCGHLGGKQLIDLDAWRVRVRAAVLGRIGCRRRAGEEIVLIARTDALSVRGFDNALERVLIARDLGADMAFIEGIAKPEDIKRAVVTLAPMPLMMNLVPNSKTPPYTLDQLTSFGVKLAIYSAVSANAALHSIRSAMAGLRDRGVDDAGGGVGNTWSPKDFFQLTGLEREVELDKRAGGDNFQA